MDFSFHLERSRAILKQHLSKHTLIILNLFVICFCNVFPSYGEGKSLDKYTFSPRSIPWEITAKSLSYSEKDSTYIAEGDVVIKGDGQYLYADKAIYNRDEGIVKVTGNVSFLSGGDTLSGESGIFNLKDQTGEVTKGMLFIEKNHYYITGDSMEKLSDNRYRITNCRLTTCDGPDTAWSITGEEVEITVEGYGKVRNAALRLKETPFFFLPYFIFPAKTER